MKKNMGFTISGRMRVCVFGERHSGNSYCLPLSHYATLKLCGDGWSWV